MWPLSLRRSNEESEPFWEIEEATCRQALMSTANQDSFTDGIAPTRVERRVHITARTHSILNLHEE
jgi:hypothetical protein